MGPRSTAPFIDLVVTECQTQYGARDDIDFPKMMICSQPAPFYEDRPIDHRALEAAIRDGLQHLERSGADFLAIACNTAHVYYPQLAASVRVPLLNMVELTVAAIPGSARRLAVIAARPTAESRIYEDAIEQRGFHVVDLDWQSDVDHLLGASRTSADRGLFARLWAGLTHRAEAANADTIVVACLDLSGILSSADTTLHMLDASQCLAREIVAEWLRRGSTTEAPFRDAPPNVVEKGWTSSRLDARRGTYTISTDPARLDVDAIHGYLTRSYWAQGIAREVVVNSLRRSLCFGLFDSSGRQVGFARVVTDGATFAYLSDVYVLEEHRKQGLGTWMIEVVTQHPALQTLRRFMLATRDAHGLYSRFGFAPLQAPERLMEIVRPDA